MKIYQTKKITNNLIKTLINIWEPAVIKTHTFLTIKEIENIKKYVPLAIKSVSILLIAITNKEVIAFIGINNQKIEMLFVKNEFQGLGVGKKLIKYAKNNYNINEITVNEQNKKALGFYKHLGFQEYKRSDLDEEGNHYPIIYMKIKS